MLIKPSYALNLPVLMQLTLTGEENHPTLFTELILNLTEKN
jgi:hypothetical protein